MQNIAATSAHRLQHNSRSRQSSRCPIESPLKGNLKKMKSYGLGGYKYVCTLYTLLFRAYRQNAHFEPSSPFLRMFSWRQSSQNPWPHGRILGLRTSPIFSWQNPQTESLVVIALWRFLWVISTLMWYPELDDLQSFLRPCSQSLVQLICLKRLNFSKLRWGNFRSPKCIWTSQYYNTQSLVNYCFNESPLCFYM